MRVDVICQLHIFSRVKLFPDLSLRGCVWVHMLYGSWSNDYVTQTVTISFVSWEREREMEGFPGLRPASWLSKMGSCGQSSEIAIPNVVDQVTHVDKGGTYMDCVTIASLELVHHIHGAHTHTHTTRHCSWLSNSRCIVQGISCPLLVSLFAEEQSVTTVVEGVVRTSYGGTPVATAQVNQHQLVRNTWTTR